MQDIAYTFAETATVTATTSNNVFAEPLAIRLEVATRGKIDRVTVDGKPGPLERSRTTPSDKRSSPSRWATTAMRPWKSNGANCRK